MFARGKALAIFGAIFAVIVWGASFVATKIALRSIQPVTIVWLRFGIGVIILATTTLLRRQFALPAQNELGYFALLGFLGITFHQWLQSTGLQTSQATTTAWIIATTPVFMALLGWLVLHEHLGGLQAAGILLAAVGVLLVVSQGGLSTLTKGRFGAPGDGFMLVSALNWAIFSTLSRRGLQHHPATRMMFYVMTSGWLFISVLFVLGPGLADIAHLDGPGWLGVIFLGVFCSGLAYIFWYDALKILPVAQTGAYLYFEPFVTAVVAAALLNEVLGWSSFLGGAAILLGVWMVNRKAPID